MTFIAKPVLKTHRALVCGWFSFEQMGASAGDLLAADLVMEWLSSHKIPCDKAVAPPFSGDVLLANVDALDYSHILFVCGPFGNGWPVPELLIRFEHCIKIGINLSMIQPLVEWNPFNLLLERDSTRCTRADIVFLSAVSKVPCIGRILVHPQKEYSTSSCHAEANSAIERLLSNQEAAIVDIDTRLDINRTGLRTPAEVESLISRMDIVVTTRLHGTVLALKNGVPALVIDPIAGGAKIQAQAKAIEWPIVFTPADLDDSKLASALAWCLTDAARSSAHYSAKLAQQRLAGYLEELNPLF